MNKQQIKRLESWVNKNTQPGIMLGKPITKIRKEEFEGRFYVTDGIVAFNLPANTLSVSFAKNMGIHSHFTIQDGLIIRVQSSAVLKWMEEQKEKHGGKSVPMRIHNTFVNPTLLAFILRVTGNDVEIGLPETWEKPLLFAGKEIGALLMPLARTRVEESDWIDLTQFNQAPKGWVLNNPWKQ